MTDEKKDRLHRKMTEEPIPRLLLWMAAPSTVAMVMTAMYSLADSLYVSRLGTAQGAAIGIGFGIQATVQALSYTLGVGGGSLLSRALGGRECREAGRFARVALWLSTVGGLFITVGGLLWGEGLVRFLGADGEVLPFARSYTKYLLYAAFPMCISFVLSQLLRAEGHSVWSMSGILIGSLCNILLDPIFIFKLGMGVSGASLATCVSQWVSAAVLLGAYLLRVSHVELLTPPRLSDFRSSARILTAGLASSGRQGLSALATILLNHAASEWGASAVAAMSVVSRLFLLAFALCLGIGQGMMPIAGYNYGCGRCDRVRHAYRLAGIAASAVLLGVSLPAVLFPERFILLFQSDAEVVAIGAIALRAQATVMLLHGAITCTNMLLQALGHATSATVLAAARQGIFFLPLFFLFPAWFGIESIVYVQPIADALTFLFTLPFLLHTVRVLKAKKQPSHLGCKQ